MKIEEIVAEWEKDGEIDTADIIGESARIPKLHNKYFTIYMAEGIKLKKMRAEYKKMVVLKTDYYRGDMDPQDIRELGWPVLNRRYIKQEIPNLLEADQDLIEVSLKIGTQEYKVEYLESIIKSISNRGFQLKNIIDWSKFTSGG